MVKKGGDMKEILEILGIVLLCVLIGGVLACCIEFFHKVWVHVNTPPAVINGDVTMGENASVSGCKVNGGFKMDRQADIHESKYVQPPQSILVRDVKDISWALESVPAGLTIEVGNGTYDCNDMPDLHATVKGVSTWNHMEEEKPTLNIKNKSQRGFKVSPETVVGE